MPDSLFYATVGVFAAQVDDLEGQRISSDHRYRTLTTRDVDKNGIERGMNLGIGHPLAARLREVTGGMKALEAAAIRNLEKIMSDSEWGPWLKQAKGIGAKQLARLLAATGDPYWHSVQDRPRRVGELWAYCGYHAVRVSLDGKVLATSGDSETSSPDDSTRSTGSKANSSGSGEDLYFAAPRRQRGVQANWSEDARKRAWLIAMSCVKQKPDTTYRMVYDDTRAKYEEAVHKTACVRCGPAGKPAEVGSPLSNGHQHGRAVRMVAKTVLKHLWIEARRQHGHEPPGGDIEDYEQRKAYEAQRAAEREPVLVAT